MQQNEKVHSHKRKKSLFIPIKLHSITIRGVIDYILEAHSTSSSLKKKKRRRKGKRWKRGEEEKRDGKSLSERGRIICGRKEEIKKGRMRCGRKEERKEERMKEKEKETKGEEEKEEQKIEKAAQEMYRPPQTHSLARS